MRSIWSEMSYWKFSAKLFGPMYDMWMNFARCCNENSSRKTYVLAEKPFVRSLSTINSTSTALNVNRVSLLGSQWLFAWAVELPYFSSHRLPLQRQRYDKSVYRHKIGNIKTRLPIFFKWKSGQRVTCITHISPWFNHSKESPHPKTTNDQSTQLYFILCSLIVY